MDETDRSVSANRRRLRFRGWRLFAVAFLLACTVLLIIRGFLCEVYAIPSESMRPLLEPGDRIIVDRTDRDIGRGDVVVFDGEGSLSPYRGASPWLSNPLQTAGQWLGIAGSDTIYVKRVIGLGGDTVSCCTNGKITVNGQEVTEDYLYPGDSVSASEFTVSIPEGRMWVMGDHRAVSRDSRDLLAAPGGGMVRVDKVIGKPVFIAWPFSRWGEIEQ